MLQWKERRRHAPTRRVTTGLRCCRLPDRRRTPQPPPHQVSAEEPGYELRVTGPAGRQLNRLPEGTAAAIVAFLLGALFDNAHRLGGALQRELAGMRSARRGARRIIYEIDDTERLVVVYRIERHGLPAPLIEIRRDSRPQGALGRAVSGELLEVVTTGACLITHGHPRHPLR